MRYMPASVKHAQTGGHSDGFVVYQARGKNVAGNELGDPTKINEGWLEKHPGARKLVGV